MTEDGKKLCERKKQELEREYGLSLNPKQILELLAMKKSQRLCKNCDGVHCLNMNQTYSEAVVEKGELYIVEKMCPHAVKVKLKAISRKAGIPARYADKTFDDYKETRLNGAAIMYALEPTERWLYMHGGCGTGKTFLASLIGKENLRGGREVIFLDFQSLLDKLKSSFDDKQVTADEVLKKYQTCEMLILDDIGTGWFRDWGVSVLHQLINYRYNENLQTILTSNYDLDGLKWRLSKQEEYAAERIISRLREMSDVVYMGEGDRRNE